MRKTSLQVGENIKKVQKQGSKAKKTWLIVESHRNDAFSSGGGGRGGWLSSLIATSSPFPAQYWQTLNSVYVYSEQCWTGNMSQTGSQKVMLAATLTIEQAKTERFAAPIKKAVVKKIIAFDVR